MKTQKLPILISNLITKYLKNELSASERSVFEQWLNEDPSHLLLVESFRDTHQVQQELNYLHQVDVNAGWNKFMDEVRPQPRLNWKKIISYSSAAIVLIAMSFALIYYVQQTELALPGTAQEALADIMPGSQKAELAMADGTALNLVGTPNKSQIAHLAAMEVKDGFLCYKNRIHKGYNSLSTPKAGEYKVILPDGSKVFLNAASTVKFPANFNQNRCIELKGEAYFEVAHNKANPFRVLFNDTQVEVLGTHFNINSYAKNSKTTLIEGSIKITENNIESLLRPGEEANIANGTVDINKADTYKSIAWKEGMFYFQDDDMKEILSQVSRWYDVEIVYVGKPSAKKYSGDIRRQATLNQVLAMLNAVSGVDFTLNKKTLTVNF
ncbi:MAG: FecR domain-containing protein [Pedobacter sp.]|nr:FecR domain-containing protein [Pedobacter sp.]MDQ8054134.1 FecR domain-containing protein [Pedobacter sp.]